MNMLFPALLPGLALALAPVTIYLLLRRRKTEVPWGASYLLRLTLASRRKSSLWKQIVVLAVRTLILLLAGLLIAQPFRPNPASSLRAPRLPEAPVHRVLLLDDSASMNIAAGGDTRLDRLKAAARPLLSALRPGDRATLLLLTPGPGPARRPAVTLEGPVPPGSLAAALAGLQTSESPIDLEAALAAALASLRATPRSAGEIYILSDFPRDLALDQDRLAALARRAAHAGARIVPVNLAAGEEADPRNVVIQSLDLGVDTAYVGLPLYVYADVDCLSDRPLAATFEASIDGRPAAHATVELQPNEHRRVPLAVTFDTPGPAVLRVAVNLGRPDAGGTRDLALTVRDKLRVWVLGDEPRENDLDPVGDAAFLARALAAMRSDFLVVEQRPANDAMLPIPPEVDLAIVAGPRFPRPAMAQSLTALAKRGGGVVWAVTADLEIDAANEDLATLLPSQLERPAFDAADPESFVSIRPEPEPGASALFAEFASASSAAGIADNNPLARAGTDTGADLAQARIYNYHRLAAAFPSGAGSAPTPAAATQPSVVFRLSDDQPLLVHRRLGRGHVYQLTTTLGVNWNSLAVRQAYIPFFLRLAQAAASGREPPRDFAPGTHVVLSWSAGAAAKLVTPGGDALPADVASAGDASFAIFEAPAHRGLYQLAGGEGSSPQRLTVRGPVPEADTRTLDADQSKLLAAALGVPVHAGWREAVRALGPDDATHPLWPWLLAALLALYFFEAWFVRLL